MIFSFHGMHAADHFKNREGSRGSKRPLGTVFLLPLLCCAILSGCSLSSDTPFPKVTQPQATQTSDTSSPTGEPSVTPSASSSGATVLRVAAPLSNTTIQYLLKLYALKSSGPLEEGVTGANISLDTLDAVDPPFTVELLQTPSTGATEDTIEQWNQNGIVPDIIYTNSLSSLCKNGEILPLNDYIAGNPLYLPSRIYLNMLQEACSLDSRIYGIPYASSAEVLYVNNDVLAQAGIDSLPFNLDLDTLMSVSASVKNMYPETTALQEKAFAFYKPSELLPFLPSAYEGNSSWFVFNGSSFDFSSAAFGSAVNFLRSYDAAGYSVESLSAEDQAAAFSTLDPRLSGRVGMWVGSTDENVLWSNTAWTISIAQLPAENAQEESPLALTVYPLCISSATDSPQLASDFASFVALDEDAVLLASRLEQSDGLLPVISSDSVWESVVKPQPFGDNLMLLKSRMPDAYYNPVTNHEPESILIQQMLHEYEPEILDDTIDLQTLINLLSSTKLAAS